MPQGVPPLLWTCVGGLLGALGALANPPRSLAITLPSASDAARETRVTPHELGSRLKSAGGSIEFVGAEPEDSWLSVVTCELDDETVCHLRALAAQEPSAAPVCHPSPRGRAEHDPACAERSALGHLSRAAGFFRRLAASSEPDPRVAEPLFPETLHVLLGPPKAKRANGSSAALPWALFLARDDHDGALLRQFVGLAEPFVWVGWAFRAQAANAEDVLAHELTHAVLGRGRTLPSWVVAEKGASIEAQSVAEGLADYFAAAFSEDPRIGESATRTPRDIAAPPPEFALLSGRPHLEGAVLSTTLWRTRAPLSAAQQQVFDALVFRIARTTPQVVRMNAFAENLLAALRTTELEPVRTRLQDGFRERGILPRAGPIVDLVPERRLLAPDLGFVLPGRQGTPHALMPGVFQVRVALPERARTLRGRFRAVPVAHDPWMAEPRSPAERVALVSWDRPLQWNPVRAAMPATATSLSVQADTFEAAIPAGAKSAFLQFANAGEATCAFNDLVIGFVDPAASRDQSREVGPAEHAPTQTMTRGTRNDQSRFGTTNRTSKE